MMNRRGEPIDVEEYNEPELWLFLTDYHDGMIYSELSCPSARQGDEVVEYRRRIPLPPVAFEPASDVDLPPVEAPDDDPHTSHVVDVEPLE
ncbi:hypothetical protein C8E95_2316 [Pseudonocardia autotrophica]|uniref:Uncharacterized protein n=2 Tax=Pseudonocardia TaxID=1847 RepID=A0A1Y2MHX8_PSEAH|nr:hypothetical protein BG845_06614 [Pseudonocardia autotrophica]TDN73228.1 hypothetical protein C8E95_2316 [Pseudonocardia autotrophica]